MKYSVLDKAAHIKITGLLILLLICVPALSWAQNKPAASNYPDRYMGAEANIITAPNGARIYDEALERVSQIVYTEPTVQNLGDGVWVIGGYSIANSCVIETAEGLIVYDTGDNTEEGKLFRQVIEEKISKKPIKAIIYSHSHYALGGGAMEKQ